MGRILALDIGEKRIGVAVSDPLKIIAQPLTTINFQGIRSLLVALKELIREQDAECIVVGIPYTLKKTLSQKTKEVLEIKAILAEKLNILVDEEDERLTTVMAEDSLRMMGKKPSNSRGKIDQIAAVHILQSYLQRKQNSKEKSW